jgi:hypothetical protein
MASTITEQMVSAAADAYYGAVVSQAADSLILPGPSTQELEKLFPRIMNSNDLTCAILAAALIDETFVSYYRIITKNAEPSLKKDLFSNLGPLSTLNSRVTLARAFGWIRKSTFHQLNIVRKIRNEFAHNHNDVNFYSPKLKNLTESMGDEFMVAYDAVREVAGAKFKIPQGRLLFCAKFFFLYGRLVVDLTVSKTAREFRVRESDIAEKAEDIFMPFQRICAKNMLECCKVDPEVA